MILYFILPSLIRIFYVHNPSCNIIYTLIYTYLLNSEFNHNKCCFYIASIDNL